MTEDCKINAAKKHVSNYHDLVEYCVFRHVRTNGEKSTAFTMAVYPFVAIYRSRLQETDSCQIWLWGLYGNLSINSKFG